MTNLRTERISLSTGVSLDVCLGGPRGSGDGEPIMFLHGFPESHRTWRHQLEDLSRDHFVVAPDQRGYAGSDKPEGVKYYETDRIVADAIALADALDIDSFTLAGHDWGGAVAWLAALTHPFRITRLIVVNAPHPLIFARSLVDDPDQRAASQYITALRSPLAEAGIKLLGLDGFFDKVFGASVDTSIIAEEERQAYIRDWSQPGALTAMLNWYRASKIEVPAPGEEAKKPLWTHAPFPHLKMPVLVVWGMRDAALLPSQLDGLDELVDDLTLVKSEQAGHFITWEEPDTVTDAIRDFLDDTTPLEE